MNRSDTDASLAGREPQTKDRLTGDDPPGWYELVFEHEQPLRRVRCRWWSGSSWEFFANPEFEVNLQYPDLAYIRGPLVHAPELQQQLSEAQAIIARLKEQAAESNTSWAMLLGLWLDTGDKASQLQAEVERLKQERDAALKQLSEMATKCGQAEGKLLASEHAGLLEEWRQRAEAAEARIKELEQEVKLLNDVYGGDAAALMRAAQDSVKQLEAERDGLQTKLDSLISAGLNANAVFELVELKQRVEAAEARVKELEAENNKLRSWGEFIKRWKAQQQELGNLAEVLRGPAPLKAGRWQLLRNQIIEFECPENGAYVLHADQVAIRLPEEGKSQ